MKIAVCVKQVPDAWAEKRYSPEELHLDRESADGVMNELDEYAVEEALGRLTRRGARERARHHRHHGSRPRGRDRAQGAEHGCRCGIHVVDDGLRGSDAIATSAVLAGAIAGRGWIFVIFGSESTDARMSVVPAMVAERLGWAQLTFAQRVDVSGSDVTIERVTESGFATVTAATPAVVSVVEKINEPRYPSFKGIMAAKKKPVETLAISDTGVDESAVGAAAAWSTVRDFAARPPKAAGVVVTDEGDGGVKVADVPLRAEVHLGSLSDE